MSSRFLILLAFLVFFLAQVSSEVDNLDEIKDHKSLVVRGANRRLLPFMDCEELCKGRCRLHSRPNMCTRACGTCCFRCKCVPPGTAGNRELCGKCYTDMTTHGNRTKCP